MLQLPTVFHADNGVLEDGVDVLIVFVNLSLFDLRLDVGDLVLVEEGGYLPKVMGLASGVVDEKRERVFIIFKTAHQSVVCKQCQQLDSVLLMQTVQPF